jgi:transposase-like protein
VSRGILLPLIENTVEPGAQIFTDQWVSYNPLRHMGYKHSAINHIERYVDGMVHTNGIENFWSLLKRGVIGTYHHVSLKHLPLYLSEFQTRFNNRENHGARGQGERPPSHRMAFPTVLSETPRRWAITRSLRPSSRRWRAFVAIR